MGDWKTPDNCRYTKTDEWVRLEGSEAVIGITDYAQDQLSDLVYVEFPEVGNTVAAGDEVGVVESVKASAPIKAPIGGEIIAVNTGLEGNESTINEDPYGKGWMVRLRVTDGGEVSGLMDAKGYTAYCNERS
jgi:glycine cleavage system H protein